MHIVALLLLIFGLGYIFWNIKNTRYHHKSVLIISLFGWLFSFMWGMFYLPERLPQEIATNIFANVCWYLEKHIYIAYTIGIILNRHHWVDAIRQRFTAVDEEEVSDISYEE